MIKKTLLSIIVCSIIYINSFAQELPEYTYKGLVAYFELGGVNIHYTLNAEHVIGQLGNFKLNLRAGFGYKKYTSDVGLPQKFLAVPVGIQAYNYLASNSHTDWGLGIAYIQGINAEARSGYFNRTLVLAPNVGYRFQKPTGGIFLKIQYTPGIPLVEFKETPIFTSYKLRKYYHSGGISVGYFFSRK
jgi:hypothetical protein